MTSDSLTIQMPPALSDSAVPVDPKAKKICGYCDEAINDAHFSFMWFPGVEVYKPVHDHHLRQIKPKSREAGEHDR